MGAVVIVLVVIAMLAVAVRAYGKGTLPPIVSGPSLATEKIAQAIARAEGWYVPGSLPRRLNNPGSLKLDGDNLTRFGTVQQGWNALYHQVELMVTARSAHYHPGMTWREIARIYTGGDRPDAWAQNVAIALAVSPDSTLGDYLV